MQPPVPVLSVVTYPPGATKTQARLVIDGVRGAIFEYTNGGPANALVGSWARSAGTDPYGNAYPAGFFGSLVTVTQVTTEGAGNEILVYFGPPAVGNLYFSVSTSNVEFGGVDSQGNKVPLGVSWMDAASAGGFNLVNIDGGQIGFGWASAESGLAVNIGTFYLSSVNNGGSINGIPYVGVVGGSTTSLDRGQTSVNGHTTGNVTSFTNITDEYTMDAVNGTFIGASHTIDVWFNGTWGAEPMAIAANVNGTFETLCTIGAVFATGVASGDSVCGHLQLEVIAVTSTTCRIAVTGSINDNTLNGGKITNGTCCPISSTVLTGIAVAAGDFLAIAIEFTTSAAAQTIVSEMSTYTRKG